MTQILLACISCQDKSQAELIGDLLLKLQLAACVQIIDHADSMYLWPPSSGRVEYAHESILLVKTVKDKWDRLVSTVKKEHTYENPEIIALPVSYASKSYADWIKKELRT